MHGLREEGCTARNIGTEAQTRGGWGKRFLTQDERMDFCVPDLGMVESDEKEFSMNRTQTRLIPAETSTSVQHINTTKQTM